jgi:hypothetical protein
MPRIESVLAEASATIHYKLARLQTLSEWWHWLLLAVAIVAVTAFVTWMYRKDSVELPRGFAVLLCTLRLAAFAGLLFYFFGLEKRAERKLVKPSRAILLIDTSQSMGLRDAPEDGTNVPAAMSRIEQVVAELASGSLIEKLREKHEVIAYRFDQGDNPVPIASFARKPAAEEIAESQVSEDDRLRQLVNESRWLVYGAAGVFAASLIAAMIYVIGRVWSRPLSRRPQEASAAGEQTSWAILVSMVTLIAAVVLLAAASLRTSEAGILALLGIREPQATSETDRSPGRSDEAAIPSVDWVADA